MKTNTGKIFTKHKLRRVNIQGMVMFSSGSSSGFGVGSMYGGTGSIPVPGSPGIRNGPAILIIMKNNLMTLK